MIIGDGWCIMTPTKCGATSLEAMFLPKDKRDILESKHSLYPPADFKGERIMIVRDPMARWFSMYGYNRMRASVGSFCDVEAAKNVRVWFESWRWFRDGLPIGESLAWTNNNAENARTFQPDTIFKIEDGLQRFAEYIASKYKTSLVEERRCNVIGSTDAHDLYNQLYKVQREYLQAWCKPDRKMFGY